MLNTNMRHGLSQKMILVLSSPPPPVHPLSVHICQPSGKSSLRYALPAPYYCSHASRWLLRTVLGPLNRKPPPHSKNGQLYIFLLLALAIHQIKPHKAELSVFSVGQLSPGFPLSLWLVLMAHRNQKGIPPSCWEGRRRIIRCSPGRRMHLLGSKIT